MDGWMDGCIYGWEDISMDGWMGGCMDEWMGGRMDGCLFFLFLTLSVWKPFAASKPKKHNKLQTRVNSQANRIK